MLLGIFVVFDNTEEFDEKERNEALEAILYQV